MNRDPIEDLIARCPGYSRVGFHLHTHEVGEAYSIAAPGDVIYLFECDRGIATGRRITALVIDRAVPPKHIGTHEDL